MKTSDIKKELSQLSVKDLWIKLVQAKRELFQLRINTKTSHVKDYSQFKKHRRMVARAATYLRKKVVVEHEAVVSRDKA